MASSSLSVASLPGPPPTPTSLMGLPPPWLLKLATCKALDGEEDTLLALFRTCAFFRDAVARHRTATILIDLPLAAEDFPSEVERLCTVARRSSRVRLRFHGQDPPETDEVGRPPHPWIETEPHITHLLVCAMAQLEGEQPLACVKEVAMHDVVQTSLVPAWVKVLCPNATKLDLGWDTLAPHPLHQPRLHPHLQELRWGRDWDADQDPPLAQHVREQLVALPSLTSLSLVDVAWAFGEEEDERQAGRLIGSTVTRLEFMGGEPVGSSPALHRLPTQFPNLRQLDAHSSTVRDGDVEALLRLPHLERLAVWRFRLQRSHTHVAWPWADLRVGALDVDSFVRLPLDGVPACSGWKEVQPSADGSAVERVAQAIRRWCGVGGGGNEWFISGRDVAALVTTLGPLVAALPAEQQRQIDIRRLRDVTPQQVQQLGQHLPASVTKLTFDSYRLTSDALAALLPSLPATVEEVRLRWIYPALTEQQVVTLCQAAVRPIRVVVHLSMGASGLSEGDLVRIRSLLTGPEQGPSLVTLVEHLE